MNRMTYLQTLETELIKCFKEFDHFIAKGKGWEALAYISAARGTGIMFAIEEYERLNKEKADAI